MTFRKLVSVSVIAACVAMLPPASARANDGAPPEKRTTTVDFRASLDRSAAKLAADNTSTRPDNPFGSRESAAMQTGAGGGGGHTMMILGIVGTVVSLAATYFVIKQVRKTETAQAQ
jgi:hypothetical protein